MSESRQNYSDDSTCPACGARFDVLDSTHEGTTTCPVCDKELIVTNQYGWAYPLVGYATAAAISYFTHLQSVFFFLGTLFYGFLIRHLLEGALPEWFRLPLNITVKGSNWLSLTRSGPRTMNG